MPQLLLIGCKEDLQYLSFKVPVWCIGNKKVFIGVLELQHTQVHTRSVFDTAVSRLNLLKLLIKSVTGTLCRLSLFFASKFQKNALQGWALVYPELIGVQLRITSLKIIHCEADIRMGKLAVLRAMWGAVCSYLLQHSVCKGKKTLERNFQLMHYCKWKPWLVERVSVVFYSVNATRNKKAQTCIILFYTFLVNAD